VLWVGGVLAAAALAAFLYWRWAGEPALTPDTPEDEARPLRPSPPDRASEHREVEISEAELEPEEELPALAESDAWVRAQAGELSANPVFTSWLRQDELVSRFVASVDNVTDGFTPRAHLPFLAPARSFEVVERPDGSFVTAPASFARYDAIGAALASVDAEAGARLYRRDAPLLEAAFRELGYGGIAFDERAAAAVRLLLETPVPNGEETLVQPAVYWRYEDETLEGLTQAQKQLLRMGPRNVERVQAKLRELADRLGFERPAADS
jgi:hypothetical protein